jgi:hypothetical protein
MYLNGKPLSSLQCLLLDDATSNRERGTLISSFSRLQKSSIPEWEDIGFQTVC